MALNKLKKALRNPRELLMEVNSRYNWRKNGVKYNSSGVDIFSEDWDILILLDSLRVDDFEDLNTLPGTLSTRESRGGGTIEFLEGNFKDRTLSDTVYVTANPQLEANKERINTRLYDIYNVWQDRWDENLGTVHPRDMADATIQAAKEHPNKRIISHFVQPHEPFIGPTADEHDLHGWIEADKEITWSDIPASAVKNIARSHDTAVYRRAYRENIEIALPHVATILESIDGKLVVTSDHAELFGERVRPIPIRYDSHRIGCHVDAMVTVPWLEYTSGNRREVIDGSEKLHSDGEDGDVGERLQDLGYL